MESSAPAERPRKGQGVGPRWTAVEHALIKSKRDKIKIILTLALETDFTDGYGCCKAEVCEVGKGAILFSIDNKKRWIFTTFIVSAEPVDE